MPGFGLLESSSGMWFVIKNVGSELTLTTAVLQWWLYTRTRESYVPDPLATPVAGMGYLNASSSQIVTLTNPISSDGLVGWFLSDTALHPTELSQCRHHP